MSGRPKAFETILIGGLIAGYCDGLDAVIYYNWAVGRCASPAVSIHRQRTAGRQVFQRRLGHSRYSALCCTSRLRLGRRQFSTLACRAIPALWKQPWLTGPAYGLVVYSVMHYIVVPMSAVAARKSPMSGMELADQLFSHMFFVGLPIALMARRSART